MKSDPFARSASFAAAVDGASFSASAAIRSTVDNTLQPIPTWAGTETRRQFIGAAIRSAGAVVTAYNGGETVTASTSAVGTSAASMLVVDPDRILEIAATDPARAVDYTTGRLLTQASAGEALRAAEVKWIRSAVRDSRTAEQMRSQDYPFDAGMVQTMYRNYAAAHLAAGVAAMRGRERVLSRWPGWASFFAAAGAADAPAGLAKFATDPKHDPIRRVAASIVARLNGWEVPEDPTLAAAITAGENAARAARWKLGSVVADAERVMAEAAALIPPPPEDPKGKGNGEQGEGEGDQDQDEHQTPDAIPGSEAEEMQGRDRSASLGSDRVTQEIRPTSTEVPDTGPGGLDYTVSRLPVHPCRYNDERMRTDAAPLLAAVRRVAWDTLRPPQFDRGQATGDLDEGAMHRLAAWQDPEVFEVREDEGRGRVAVFLLVDCSGSMQSHRRIDDARAVAFALATAFGQHPRYTLRIAGHDVGYSPRRVRLWQCAKPADISGLEAVGDNADGFAIHAAMRDIEAVPAERRAVILMADGQPNAQAYGGERAARHIRTIVEAGAKRGTQFLALGIGGAMTTSGGRLFGRSRFVSLPDTRSAGPLLARLMAKMGQEVQPCG
jgi:hypothetical protein